MKKFFLVIIAIFSVGINAKIHYWQLAHILNIPKIEAKRIMNVIAFRRRAIEVSWEAYYTILPQFINNRNYKNGCEVGVAFGGHSESILRSTEINKMYCIDPYVDYSGVAAAWGIKKKYWQACWDGLFYYVQDRLSPFGERVEMVRKTADEAAIGIPENSLDFVFIDGDHSYAAVLQDLFNYYDKVRSGGMISGDDYNLPEVGKAVSEFFTQKGLKVNQNNEQERFWWVDKP